MGTSAIYIILWSCLGHVQKTKRPRRELFLSVPYSLAPSQNIVVDTCVFCMRHQSRIHFGINLSTISSPLSNSFFVCIWNISQFFLEFKFSLSSSSSVLSVLRTCSISKTFVCLGSEVVLTFFSWNELLSAQPLKQN